MVRHAKWHLYVCTGAHSVSNMTAKSEIAIQMCFHKLALHYSSLDKWTNHHLCLTDSCYIFFRSLYSRKVTHSLWMWFPFEQDLSNMQTDKCLKVNHGWRSHESDVGYVIVLCLVPPGKTMWWSARVTSVFLRWHKNKWSWFFQIMTIKCGSAVRRLHWVLSSLRLKHKLKHYIKDWLPYRGPPTL